MPLGQPSPFTLQAPKPDQNGGLRQLAKSSGHRPLPIGAGSSRAARGSDSDLDFSVALADFICRLWSGRRTAGHGSVLEGKP
jgi:hypothetical protein